jgi:hypothetical protein
MKENIIEIKCSIRNQVNCCDINISSVTNLTAQIRKCRTNCNDTHFIFKKLCGHSRPMSVSSSSSRRAQAIQQCAIISGHESEPILFSPLLFAAKSRRYLEDLVLGSGLSGIVINSKFDRDSVVGFIAACEDTDFSVTQSNVFDIEVLCDEWSVVGKSICRKLTEFIEYPPSGQNLWLFFRLGRGLSTEEAKDLLHCNLVCLFDDSAALEIPAAILSRIIGFRSCEGRREEYERLFAFCIEYLSAHGSSASQIMRTLDVTQLSDDDLGRLCALEQLNWGVLSESLRRCLIGLRRELSGAQQQKGELETKVREQAQEIENLHKEVVQAQTEKVAMKATVDEHQRRIGELEGESQTQKGTIVRQTSEIEGLTTAKKKCENELERSTGAAEA